jgi:hypothetical protein
MLGITLVGACVRRPVRAAPQPIVPPAGLDSAQTAAWIARQQAACPGDFAILKDLRAFAVRCDTNSSRHPPNER